eukprot:CAMPEP_0195520156 /NCGR_PEP_ID=MMETSP0794_2-20130614/16281_1 /TAXON_ID=515487 /ORGANISM="Stephanopyxis turris, Strain CCMP 815" /LENGTH=850 /DNA_ID=CAMNT_0040649447 /DNA_START=370 /DNA_END=2922 /DNA_ORIENTATION=+
MWCPGYSFQSSPMPNLVDYSRNMARRNTQIRDHRIKYSFADRRKMTFGDVTVCTGNSRQYLTMLQNTRGNSAGGESPHNQRKTEDTIVAEEKEEKEEEEEKEEQKQTKGKDLRALSARYVDDNGISLTTDENGTIRATKPGSSSSSTEPISPPAKTAVITKNTANEVKEHIPKIESIAQGFNVVLTHCTADFDSLASAVGLAKLWSSPRKNTTADTSEDRQYDDYDSRGIPTFVVLPRGAHPAVQRFLALHKHLFPIRNLKSLPSDLNHLNRLGLVDAQRRDRIGPAEHLIGYANRVTVVDHHIDAESDIPEATDYVCDAVGSVSTIVAERLREANMDVSEAEATLLALGIHADTGSLCFDSTTPRDANALAWVMEMGASQTAIAEHAHSSLSQEQQGVLTQSLINMNSSVVHGVTVSTVLLSADSFINGLAAVTADALELSSSDILLLSLVYDAKTGGSKKKKMSNKDTDFLLKSLSLNNQTSASPSSYVMQTEAWKGGEEALKRKRLRAAFDKKDLDGSGYLERDEIESALASSGVIASELAINTVMDEIDTDGDGKVDFEEFIAVSAKVEKKQKHHDELTGKKASTMIIIGRVKSGVAVKSVKLNKLLERFGGGGHAKAASATVRLDDDTQAGTILQEVVDELIETSLLKQPTVGDFMTAPVLSAKPTMTENVVEDLFTRYDVRALPVVDDENNVIGLVTYKEVAAAKQRLWNKEQKRLRREAQLAQEGGKDNKNKKNQDGGDHGRQRKLGSALKGWMKQHVKIVEAATTMAEVEAVLLENDVGCIPVVADGTKQLVGMVTRTDLLRQHRYYPSLHYHNKGFADSIAARKPIIELRKKLKKFDLENE